MAAEHNQLKYFVDQQKGVGRAVGLDEQADGTTRLSETLYPIFDQWREPQWAWLRRETLWARQIPVPAGGAGTFATLEFVNAAGSGIIAVITQIKCSQAFSLNIDFVVNSGPATGNGVVGTFHGVSRDTRNPQLGEASVCTLVASNNLLASANLPQRRLSAAFSEEDNSHYIIVPGKSLFIAADVAVQKIEPMLSWTERKALPGELGGA